MITVLFLPATPGDAARQYVEKEMRELDEKLRMFGLHDQLTFRLGTAAGVETLSQVLRDEQPGIVHFAAPRPGPAAIVLEDSTGATAPVAPDVLAALFEPLAGQIWGGVLDGCYAEDQANALARHVSYVIGLSAAMWPLTARTFNLGFYQSTDRGVAAQDAFQFGVLQIGLQRIYDSVTPVLIKQS